VEHQAKLSASPLPADYSSASVVTRPRQGSRKHLVRVRDTASTETTTLLVLSKVRPTSQGHRENSVRVRDTASSETTSLFISSEATTRTRKVNAYVHVCVHDTTIGTNRHVKQNVVIHDLIKRYILCPGVKYPMCSFKSNTDSMIFISRRLKARLYIYIVQIKFNSVESPRDTRRCYSPCENAICVGAKSEVQYVFLHIKH
jgi:hypothetical protein